MTPQAQVVAPAAPRPADSLNQSAVAIVAEASSRGYTPAETKAVLATAIQESSLRHNEWGDKGKSYGLFQQDGSYGGRSYEPYRGRSHPNQQIREFFDRLSEKRAMGAPDDIWFHIYWLQQRPGDKTAEEARRNLQNSNAYQAYVSQIRSKEAAASKLYDRIAKELPEALEGRGADRKPPLADPAPPPQNRPRPVTEPRAPGLLPPLHRLTGAGVGLNDNIAAVEKLFYVADDALRTSDPAPAPEQGPLPAVKGVDAVGKAAKEYQLARGELVNKLRELQIQNRDVADAIKEVVTVVIDARKQLLEAASLLNRSLESNDTLINLPGKQAEAARNVTSSLTIATQHVETILQLAKARLQPIADKVDAATAATTTQGPSPEVARSGGGDRKRGEDKNRAGDQDSRQRGGGDQDSSQRGGGNQDRGGDRDPSTLEQVAGLAPLALLLLPLLRGDGEQDEQARTVQPTLPQVPITRPPQPGPTQSAAAGSPLAPLLQAAPLLAVLTPFLAAQTATQAAAQLAAAAQQREPEPPPDGRTEQPPPAGAQPPGAETVNLGGIPVTVDSRELAKALQTAYNGPNPDARNALPDHRWNPVASSEIRNGDSIVFENGVKEFVVAGPDGQHRIVGRDHQLIAFDPNNLPNDGPNGKVQGFERPQIAAAPAPPAPSVAAAAPAAAV
jgi:hypothetical protein